jgi:hypothetical protein
LLAPDGVEDLFGKKFKMNIDKETLELSSQILEDVKIFEEALEACDEIAEQTYNRKKADEATFENILRKQISGGGFNKQVLESFYKIYGSLKTVKEKGRDSIWKFIVGNLYMPYFISKKFDYVVGNPPWFTYSSIKNEEYQNTLNALADIYDVKPKKVANFPHLEIAAIFLSYCSSYFLKENGKIAFVLPRSFFSSDHHDNTRSGKAKGFRLENIWDLNEVSPLFRIPSSVLFGKKEKDKVKRSLPSSGLDGIIFNGKLPSHNCNLKTAEEFLKESKTKWNYVKQGSSSAFSTHRYKSQSMVNPYKNKFKQGATIVPRSFYFVELTQEMPEDFNDRIINIKTSEAIKVDAKPPWKPLDIIGRIESKFLFRTALSKSILPFALFKPDLVALPITIKLNEENEKEITLHSADDLMSEGYLNASKWFKHAENFWELYKTDKSKEMTTLKRLNYQRGITEQNLNMPYLVIYNSSAINANATLVTRQEIDLEFIVESKGYAFITDNQSEAHYLLAILNSKIPNELMKDFQSRGLWGARDVHKKILDIYYPKFDEKEETHLRIAELSKTAHENAAQYLKVNPPEKELTATRLGKLRVDIKKHLSAEMKEIDRVVKKIIN